VILVVESSVYAPENVRLHPLQRAGEVGDEVDGIFDADGVAD
jgi:hypothetical protein